MTRAPWKKWTADEVRGITALAAAGVGHEEIGRRVGRSAVQVYSKLRHLTKPYRKKVRADGLRPTKAPLIVCAEPKCGRRMGKAPRGLCWTCYGTPTIRARHKTAPKTRADGRPRSEWRKWTAAEVRELINLKRCDFPRERIAKELGRTEGQIQGKLKAIFKLYPNLKVSRNGSPER